MCRVSSASTTSASRSSASTRNVTSSRLPIGVAQTASGTAPTLTRARREPRAPRRSCRRRGRAARARSAPRPPRAAPRGGRPRAPARRAGRTAACPKPPPMTTTSGPNAFTADAIAVPRCLPSSSSAGCLCSTRSCARRVRPEHALREPVGRRARAVRLDVAAPRARALARLAVLDDHHVPELGPAAVEPAAGDDAAADARPEREQHELARALAGAGAVLGEGGGARVVVDADRQAEPLAHLGAEVRGRAAGCSTAPRTPPVRWSTRAGTPIPTAATSGSFSSRTISTIAASSASCDSTGVGRSSVRSTVPSRGDEARVDLRPAEVDPDDARAGQGGGYPTSPDGAGREAVPRLSRRSGQGEGSRADEAASGRATPPARRSRRGAAPRRRRRGWGARACGCRGGRRGGALIAIGLLGARRRSSSLWARDELPRGPRAA